MKFRLSSMLILIGALAAMSLSTAGTATAGTLSCVAIKGVGSSLQLVAQENVWTGSWEANECSSKPAITYKGTSSGNGKKQWGSGGKLEEFEKETPLAAFIGSDTAASEAQILPMNTAGEQGATGIVAVPVAQSAITQIVSLPVGCLPAAGETTPEISGKKLAEEWEKGSISFATLLSVDGACSGTPLFEARSSNSGTTAGEKHYFKTLTNSKEWIKVTETLGKAEEPVWPAANTKIDLGSAKGNELVSLVSSTPGSIGYADLGDAEPTLGVAWALHTVSSKSVWSGIAKVQASTAFESPEATEGESNCGKAKYSGEASKSVKPNEDWSEVIQTNVAENGAYSVCTLTFDLAWHKYETGTLEPLYGGSAATAKETANSVVDYLHWIVSTGAKGGQGILALKQKHYGALPKTIDEAALKGVTKANIE